MPWLLLDQLRLLAQNSPDKAALVEAESGITRTWAQLWNASMELAARLSRQLPPGAVVILRSPNCSAFVAGYVGVLAAGCKVFPLTPQSTSMELANAVAGSKAAAMIGDFPTGDEFARSGTQMLSISLEEVQGYFEEASADRTRDRGPCAAGMLLSSSGSTAQPKIIHRSAAALDAVAVGCWKSVGFGPADHVLAAVPLCHSFGVEHGLLAPLCAGSCVHLCRGFDLPVILRELRHNISIFPAVPFMIESLASGGGQENLPALAHVYSAGAPLPASVAQAFADCFGIRVGQVYGATEIGSVTFSDPNSAGYSIAGVGKPMPSVQIRIDPVTAEVRIKADSMFDRYVGDDSGESRIDAAGYFQTGDLGAIDSQGNLLITGRLKLLIDVGGQKVNPLEVEQVLTAHPGVAECVVLPMPVSATVTRLRAIVTLRVGASDVTCEDLRVFTKARLSAYKVPRTIELRDSLPRSAAGKILRHLIEG